MPQVVTERSGAKGLWIAQPGYDAATCDPNFLNLATDLGLVQPVVGGVLALSSPVSQGEGTGFYSASGQAYCGDLQGRTNLVRWVEYWFVDGSGAPRAPDNYGFPASLGQLSVTLSGNYLSFSMVNGPGMQCYVNWTIYKSAY